MFCSELLLTPLMVDFDFLLFSCQNFVACRTILYVAYCLFAVTKVFYPHLKFN